MAKIEVLKFHADWCQPCKTLTPILEKVLGTVDSNTHPYIYTSIDIDSNFDTALEHGVAGVPTVIITSDDEEIARFSGGQSETYIQEFINKHIVESN